jgi:anion-transporting  ArsA/GET3 family ATPase
MPKSAPSAAGSPRLHVVTGKGGTGKTTVAASLALALAADNKSVLLCEVEGRQGLASLFDVPDLPYEERRIVAVPDGGEVHALAVDPESAFLEYLQMFYRLGPAAKALDRFGVIDFVTTVAPGVRDVLLTGKVYEAARRQRGSQSVYDAVVLDAPPTGRIGRFLNVNEEVVGVASIGRIRDQANSVMGLLRSSDTTVHMVTLLEDMPVQEALDGIDELRALGLGIGSVVLNRVRTLELGDDALARALAGRLDADALERDLKEAGVDADNDTVRRLLLEATAHAERAADEQRERDRVSSLQLPVATLPLVPDGIDLSCLYEFAHRLRDDGVVAVSS